MPSSLEGMRRASRLVSGTEEVVMEACARLRPATETSTGAGTTNPAGVRSLVVDEAASRARDCARRALALRRDSSYEMLVWLWWGRGGMTIYYSSFDIRSWWRGYLRPLRALHWRSRWAFHTCYLVCICAKIGVWI